MAFRDDLVLLLDTPGTTALVKSSTRGTAAFDLAKRSVSDICPIVQIKNRYRFRRTIDDPHLALKVGKGDRLPISEIAALNTTSLRIFRFFA
jgi:hypothetical protein